MKNCAIVGINWGDEGKGRMVDLLTKDYDVVIRYQGGGNAGHTVVNDYGKFALHLLPSGVFHAGVVNVLGNGVALDMENLWTEVEEVRRRGVTVTPSNLKISDRASLLLPWHREQDAWEEARLAAKQYGSTRQGIAPFYSDKYQKKTILAGELFYPERLREHLLELLEWKNLILSHAYGAEPYAPERVTAWIEEYGEKIKPFLCDANAYLRQAAAEGKSFLFEAQLGALRDLDYGIYPFTTSSNALAAYAPIGSGLPTVKLDEIVGVVKAYSTCVGEGPFVCELFGQEAARLREAGGEYGAKTCTQYELEGKPTDAFPFPAALEKAKPIIEELDGWNCDISHARRWEDLPAAARHYVEFIEEGVGCPIRYVSVGAERDAIILR